MPQVELVWKTLAPVSRFVVQNDLLEFRFVQHVHKRAETP
ncbi:hypothetical protein BN137_962 [Cronobacter condimenti 1330]|uniref:Uncharacterized protein n=1 Tax=Cronobacter condimenti 1330 TaxID=1073999 RepID=K8ABJ3_9ENTR|nr:hypothetical protein BN137_962 [Cronobacter condimenti 1330]